MTTQSPDVITFGETMVLLTPDHLNRIENSDRFIKSHGGAESNFAIGIARLGHSVGWFGSLGDDPFGRYIFKSIRGEGVDVTRVEFTNQAPTGFMLRERVAGQTSVYYYRHNSAASKIVPENIDEDYIKQASILHITGITCAISETAKNTVFEAVNIAKRNGVKVSFDPNIRLKLWSLEEARSVILPLAEEVDYFLPGMDELMLLYETNNPEKIFARLTKLNAVSIVKGGKKEAFLIENGKIASFPYVRVDHIVDPIGAGDGFCAGFISGLLKGFDHTDSVRYANLVGSLIIQAEGDWEGIPNWQQLQAIINKESFIER
ncbi:sugar kinase [Bacillus sp. FJAT-49711]|uniref:sugar kinase n=1 Tax=Bacillus sp. FJAT-49711 TaxID=2833585 RepID=UPI001BC9B537|nr:sugar kinase [Bacillus sp. FJAT-49711]MBS4219091.1 sugar kinase [Bacillus sp. FJAT-49711]